MGQNDVDIEKQVEKFMAEANRMPRNELVKLYTATFIDNIRLQQFVEKLKEDRQALQTQISGGSNEVQD